MNIKCIALDLDRTTLDGNGRLSPGNRDALNAASEKGIEIVVASGRSFASLPKDLRQLPGVRYAITSNGAAVVGYPGGETLQRWRIPGDSVRRMRRVLTGRSWGESQSVFIDGQAYAPTWYLEHLEKFGVSGYAKVYILNSCRPVEDWEGFLDANEEKLDSYLVMHQDPALRKELFTLLREDDRLYFTSSAPHMLEISHGDSGKGSGMRWLMGHLGLCPEECAAFGDGLNDIDLLKAVSYGIAVENAEPDCRAAAVYVTKRHDEDGVAWALKHYLKVIE